MFHIPTTLLLFAALLLASACSTRSATDERARSSSSPVADQAAAPRDLPVSQDQVEFTRNVDPSTLPEEAMPEPPAEVVPTTLDRSKRPTAVSTPSVSAVRKPGAPPAAANAAPPAPPTTITAAPAAATPSSVTPPGSTSPPNAAPATAPTNAEPMSPSPEMETASPPDHTPWNTLLQRYVAGDGDVNYAGLKASEAKLDAYLATLQASAPRGDWGRDASMAYWINAYNAFTIKRILNDYPLNSITDLDGGDPWKVKWIDIEGKQYSLNNIEHDILRPDYGDARIHFAVNCAAASCPPLPNKAFNADNLDRMLQTNARAFIRNTDYNETGGDVRVSKIFDWYAEDFGDLRAYLNKYLATPIAAGTDIGYKEYDWALNKQ